MWSASPSRARAPARHAELLGDALSFLLALQFEHGALLGIFEFLDAALLGKMCFFGGAPALFCNASFFFLTLLFSDARLFGLALGFGLFGLALHLGDARCLGLPLLFGDARLFCFAILLGDTALLGLTRCLRLPLGLGLLRGNAALILETLLLGEALLLDLALQARSLGAALLLGFALHLDFLLVGFIGEVLRLGTRGLALGFHTLLRALLIELTARFGFLRRAAQHLRLIGGALLGGLALGSFACLP